MLLRDPAVRPCSRPVVGPAVAVVHRRNPAWVRVAQDRPEVLGSSKVGAAAAAAAIGKTLNASEIQSSKSRNKITHYSSVSYWNANMLFSYKNGSIQNWELN